jgi:hypothetical protein
MGIVMNFAICVCGLGGFPNRNATQGEWHAGQAIQHVPVSLCCRRNANPFRLADQSGPVILGMAGSATTYWCRHLRVPLKQNRELARRIHDWKWLTHARKIPHSEERPIKVSRV